jgi:hypothetical protein
MKTAKELERIIRAIVREEISLSKDKSSDWMPEICKDVIALCSNEEWEELVNVCNSEDKKAAIPKKIDAEMIRLATEHIDSPLSVWQKHALRSLLKEEVRAITQQ